MANPPQDGISIGHYSDYYNGLGVHYSSGLYNKAFHQLVTVQGFTIEKAYKV